MLEEEHLLGAGREAGDRLCQFVLEDAFDLDLDLGTDVLDVFSYLDRGGTVVPLTILTPEGAPFT